MEKRLIKFGEQYFYVTAGASGLEFTAANPQEALAEVFEEVILADNSFSNEDNFLEKTLNSAREDLMRNLKSGIQGVVLKSLGFEKDSYGQSWKIDHCNGRMSQVTNYVKDEVLKSLGDFKNEHFTLTDKEREQIHKELRKEFLDYYRRVMREGMWKRVEQMVIEDSQSIANSLIGERMKEVGNAVLEKIIGKAPIQSTSVGNVQVKKSRKRRSPSEGQPA